MVLPCRVFFYLRFYIWAGIRFDQRLEKFVVLTYKFTFKDGCVHIKYLSVDGLQLGRETLAKPLSQVFLVWGERVRELRKSFLELLE